MATKVIGPMKTETKREYEMTGKQSIAQDSGTLDRAVAFDTRGPGSNPIILHIYMYLLLSVHRKD